MDRRTLDGDVPEGRCGFTLPREHRETVTVLSAALAPTASCWRPVAEAADDGRCLLHTTTEGVDRSAEAIDALRADRECRALTGPPSEVLYGACIRETDVPLSAADLRFADLSDGELRGRDISDADLRRADLTNADVALTDLTDADLRGATLVDADLWKADVAGADLRGADHSGAYHRAADFTGADLRGVAFTGANLWQSTLEGADLRSATLSEANLQEATLSRSNLRAADLTDAELDEATLTGADLRDADVRGADLTDADLGRSEFVDGVAPSIDLDGADLGGCTLAGVRAEQVSFVGANLAKADFTDANLHGADLTGVDLERAQFSRADLFDASLARADLEGTVLVGAQLNERFFENLERDGAAEGSRVGGWLVDRVAGPRGDPRYRCSYDPKGDHGGPATDGGMDTDDPEVRAAGVYHQFEQVAASNALPDWQTRFFYLRQDMQTRRRRRKGEYGRYGASLVLRTLFGHGESFVRVVGWSAVIVLVFTLLFLSGGVFAPTGGFVAVAETGEALRLQDVPGDGLVAWQAFYYSVLTFTALGFGGYETTGFWGELLTVAETSTGVILVALLVFVLGRRAAR